MEIYYIYPSMNDATRLNDIMWNAYVWDGENYKFPFDTGTTCYYDINKFPWNVTELLDFASTDPALSVDDRQFIADILATKKTEQEAAAAGWFS